MIKMLELNQAQTRIWIWWLCLLCVHLTRRCLEAPEWKRINKKRVWVSHCIIVHQNPLTWHSLASGQGKQNITYERHCIIIVHSLDSCVLSLVNLVYMGWFVCCMSMSFWNINGSTIHERFGEFRLRRRSSSFSGLCWQEKCHMMTS